MGIQRDKWLHVVNEGYSRAAETLVHACRVQNVSMTLLVAQSEGRKLPRLPPVANPNL